MAKQRTVVTIILDFHGLHLTIDCLQSQKKLALNGLKHEIIVVLMRDGGPNESTAQDHQYLKEHFPQVHVLEADNLGFSAGNNLGIEYALNQHNPDYLLLLNNDTMVSPTFLRELVRTAETKGKTLALYSPKIYFEAGYEFYNASYTKEERGKVLWYGGGLLDTDHIDGYHRGVDEFDHGQFDLLEETDFCTGCCLFFSRQTFKKLGPLSTKYFVYYEDLDYSTLAHQKGVRTYYVPKAHIWHKNAGSSGGSGSTLQVYYQTRNRLFYGIKYAKLRTKISLFKQALSMLRTGTNAQGIAVKDAFMFRGGRRKTDPEVRQ